VTPTYQTIVCIMKGNKVLILFLQIINITLLSLPTVVLSFSVNASGKNYFYLELTYLNEKDDGKTVSGWANVMSV
jgi:hypothetical protein